MTKKLTLGKKVRIAAQVEDTVDITDELAAAAADKAEAEKVAALYDTAMRELTVSEFHAMVDDAVAIGDQVGAAEAMAWLAANPDGLLPDPVVVEEIGTPEEEYAKHIEQAQAKVAEFKLQPLALTILTRACENVGSNTGRGITDRDQQKVVQQRAALMTACDNDLPAVIEIVSTSVEAESVPGMVYSLCFAVQKACNFAANLMYRKALRTDEDRRAERVERGEEPGQSFDPAHRDAPAGCEADAVTPLSFDVRGDRRFGWSGDDVLMEHEQIMEAFEELHVYLSVLPEAFGWKDEEVMPYMFVVNLDARGNPTGNFQRIESPMQALDIQEVRSAESRARRAAKQSDLLGKALAGARAALLKAGRKTA